MRKGEGGQGAAQKPQRKPATKTAPKKAVTKKAAPKKMGRPTTYTLTLADNICAQLAEGKSMRTVCKGEGMPVMSTVFLWLRTHPEFSERYTQAKAEAADALVEEMLDISDDGTNDWMEIHDKEGEAVGYKINGEHVQRSRLRVDTRKWIASKLKPKKYGERVDVDHGIQEGNPLADLFAQLAGKTLKPADQDE